MCRHSAFLLLLSLCRAVRRIPNVKRHSLFVRRLKSRRRTSKKVNVVIPDSPDGHLVTDLPLLDYNEFPTKQWAGHLPAGADGHKYFFYWLFAPDMSDTDISDSDIPLVIWLNGGPACSSMDGLFIENGPFRFEMDDDLNFRLKPDPNSWHKLPAYTLYIDQPVGTGLSFTTAQVYPRNDDMLNADFYYFLQQFLHFHSDKFVDGTAMNRHLFFAGESFAGHYNAIFTNHILKRNANLRHGDVRIPVKGAAIGNGWVDPYNQYASADFAYGSGLIGPSEVAALHAQENECRRELSQGNYYVEQCLSITEGVIDQSFGGSSNYKISSYDVTLAEKKHRSRTFPPGHKIIESYLGYAPVSGSPGKFPSTISDQALEALHATGATEAGLTYEECTDPPYYALNRLDGKGVVPDMVTILDHPDNVELLLFNGILDLVCHHVGNELSLEQLPWTHREDWISAPRYAWKAPSQRDRQVSGYMREYRNLKFLKILRAGHMGEYTVGQTL